MAARYEPSPEQFQDENRTRGSSSGMTQKQGVAAGDSIKR
jgi:hypothetical protein